MSPKKIMLRFVVTPDKKDFEKVCCIAVECYNL